MPQTRGPVSVLLIQGSLEIIIIQQAPIPKSCKRVSTCLPLPPCRCLNHRNVWTLGVALVVIVTRSRCAGAGAVLVVIVSSSRSTICHGGDDDAGVVVEVGNVEGNGGRVTAV